MKITNIEQLKVGDILYDNEEQPCPIVNILTEGMFGKLIEPVIILQHFPSKLWYLLVVNCDKCNTKSTLKFTSTISPKFRCGGDLEIDGKIYKCGGKKYTEIYKEFTGIKYQQKHMFSNIKQNFTLK